jgi:hypothetical protein
MFANRSGWNEQSFLWGHSIDDSYQVSVVDWLIDWCLTSSEQFSSYIQDENIKKFKHHGTRSKERWWVWTDNFASATGLLWSFGSFGQAVSEKSTNQKPELPVVAMFVNGSGQNVLSLERTAHRCFLPSFGSLGQMVSEEKNFKNQPIKNKSRLWLLCLLTDRDEMSNLYRGPSIDASYQVSVHLAKQFQRTRF